MDDKRRMAKRCSGAPQAARFRAEHRDPHGRQSLEAISPVNPETGFTRAHLCFGHELSGLALRQFSWLALWLRNAARNVLGRLGQNGAPVLLGARGISSLDV